MTISNFCEDIQRKYAGWEIIIDLVWYEPFITFHIHFKQVRADIHRAKLELRFELQRSPTEKEVVERIGISPERYYDVLKASKPILSLHSRHIVTQEEFINGITDLDGVDGDNRRQLAVLRLALDDVVKIQLLNTLPLMISEI